MIKLSLVNVDRRTGKAAWKLIHRWLRTSANIIEKKVVIDSPVEVSDNFMFGVGVTKVEYPPEFPDALTHHVAKNWTPCPRCTPETRHSCTYCSGTGECYKGEPQHA